MRKAIIWRGFGVLAILAGFAVTITPQPAHAYVEVPMSLGAVIQQSTNVVLMTVTKIDREKNLIIYQKVADIKGKHPQEVIKHNIGRGGLRPGEWEEIMKWAEVGKTAVFFHNGGASETFIGVTWYQAYPQNDWWGMSHGEPFLLRSYAGKVDKLPAVVTEIVNGKEVIVPCMVDGDKEALHKKIAKIQRLKASLKIQDYNAKRDFVGWGGEDIRRLAGMPGFDRYAALPKLDAEAQAATIVDFDNDGKPDICLCGANRVVLLQNTGDSFVEFSLPGLIGGARAAVWADYTGDGLPDLLLATINGPRLYTNLGKGLFRDDSWMLPKEACYNLTAAAWGDFDGDGKPDILLANGFHGLRMYRNNRPSDAMTKIAPPKLGGWYAAGPFRTTTPKSNFDMEYQPEKEPFNVNANFKGKRNLSMKWQKKSYSDAAINDLAEFGANCATYITREITVPVATDMPMSFGSDDTLTVWLNGVKLHSENVTRACAADQARLTLKLKAGKNQLLLKICNGDQQYAFYCAPGQSGFGGEPWFQDVSAAWGLGPNGIGSDVKGDTLAVADFNADGKADFLYGAGTGMVVMNAGGRFVVKPDSGINYKPGKVGPALCDFDGDGLVDLFIPQPEGTCKLYRNTGKGTFADVSAMAGFGSPIPGAVSATWGDFDNDGKPDLLICCLRGPNRYFRNNGNGTFTDKSVELGLTQKLFNSQAAAFADLNGDGQLDLILANEGQESCVLFGATPTHSGRTSLVVNLNGSPAFNGGRVVVRDASGNPLAGSAVFGGDGRGGQAGLSPRFLLTPGAYKVEMISSDGKSSTKDVVLTTAPMNVRMQ